MTFREAQSAESAISKLHNSVSLPPRSYCCFTVQHNRWGIANASALSLLLQHLDGRSLTVRADKRPASKSVRVSALHYGTARTCLHPMLKVVTAAGGQANRVGPQSRFDPSICQQFKLSHIMAEPKGSFQAVWKCTQCRSPAGKPVKCYCQATE